MRDCSGYPQMAARGNSRLSQPCMRKSKQHSRYDFDEKITLPHDIKLNNVDFTLELPLIILINRRLKNITLFAFNLFLLSLLLFMDIIYFLKE